ncbi:hypothetical protein M902_2858 [Bacteriovorax sp. BAL6_X]|uniref:hypothetical protein n=1 Tax=Bacteriovorax sp. BAL6_X TaxID=1201290 RepID=UPI00038611FF|nr:hypothetical protein [Bacteriovorax sp. BAL6_X]EPZ51281.1 hypothetical protein M902_2858 [Bacteriovorax sp. BAL6_X]
MLKYIILSIFITSMSRATVLDKDAFLNWVKSNDFQTLTQVIESIPEEDYQNMTLAYKSGALLPASPDKLRPVIWNEKNSFVITFSTFETVQNEEDSIEAISWNQEKLSYELLVLDLKNKKWLVNQAKCLECHGQRPKPLWGEYPTWRGFVGQRNDLLNIRDRSYVKNFLKGTGSRGEAIRRKMKREGAPFPFRITIEDFFDTKEHSQTDHRPNMRLGQIFARHHAISLYRDLKNALSQEELNSVFSIIQSKRYWQETNKLNLYFNKAGLTLADLDIAQVANQEIKTTWEHIYFDGDAEILEYLTWQYLNDSKMTLENEVSLEKKYPFHFPNNLDVKETIRLFDSYSKWIQLDFEMTNRNKKRKRHKFVK